MDISCEGYLVYQRVDDGGWAKMFDLRIGSNGEHWCTCSTYVLKLSRLYS